MGCTMAARRAGKADRLFWLVLGGTIAYERRQAKITQEQLAKRFGIGQPALSRIEHGNRSVDVLMFNRIPRAWRNRHRNALERVEHAIRAITNRGVDNVVEEIPREVRCLISFVLALS